VCKFVWKSVCACEHVNINKSALVGCALCVYVCVCVLCAYVRVFVCSVCIRVCLCVLCVYSCICVLCVYMCVCLCAVCVYACVCVLCVYMCALCVYVCVCVLCVYMCVSVSECWQLCMPTAKCHSPELSCSSRKLHNKQSKDAATSHQKHFFL